MNAKAVIFPDKLKVEYRDVTVPEPGPNDVVVRTKYSHISNGTEGSFLRCERINGETPYRPGDVWPFPIAAGYQSTGVVEAFGANIRDLALGQWVFCTVGRIEGMYEPWGGHISLKVTDRSQVWPIPEGVSPVAMSPLVLTQVGYNCGDRPPLSIGDAAVVIGDGLVGQWAAQTLHWRGAKTILAGKHPDRLAKFARKVGRHLLDTSQDDIAQGVARLAPEGVHIVVDTVGSLPTVNKLLPLMRHNGHVVSAGFNGTDSFLDVQLLRFKETTFHSPSGWHPRRMDETLALIASGYLDTESLITHRFPVEQAAEAWKLILDRSEPVLGVVLIWE